MYNAFRKEGEYMTTKEKEMQKALDMAWENPTEEQKSFQKKYFPNGKPSVDEFVQAISAIVKRESMM